MMKQSGHTVYKTVAHPGAFGTSFICFVTGRSVLLKTIYVLYFPSEFLLQKKNPPLFFPNIFQFRSRYKNISRLHAMCLLFLSKFNQNSELSSYINTLRTKLYLSYTQHNQQMHKANLLYKLSYYTTVCSNMFRHFQCVIIRELNLILAKIT